MKAEPTTDLLRPTANRAGRQRWRRLQGYSLALAGAVVVVFALFAAIEQLIVVPKTYPRPGQATVVENIKVLPQPEHENQPAIRLPQMPQHKRAQPPSQPQAAPAPVPVPNLPPLQAPSPALPALNVAATGIPADIGTSSNLFGSGRFAGFAGFAGSGNGTGGVGSGGSGSGGKGYGQAQNFNGKTLIPLSTARPEITKWAYEHHIEGWVTVAFTVKKNGHVTNLRIINAYPKGVFEAAAVNSVSNWIYPAQSHPVEVKQRVEFKLKDYKYNWTTG